MFSYRILLVASISTLGIGPAFAQAPAERDSRPAMQLSALDYIEIEQLNRKYAWAIDTCANDGFDYADLYTPDGVFISGDNGRRWQGREQLAEAAGGNGRGCPIVKMPLSHVIVNLLVEATPDGAIGKSYLVYPGKNGQYADDKHHGHDGGYQDIYVKTDGGWRFKERVHVHPPQIPGQYVGIPNTELDAARNAPAR
jgi:ketosteroid isomerase-like protein